MFSGWVAFDDVSLKQAGSSTNMVPDPSFDNTTSGWSASAGADFPGTMLWRGNWGPAQARTGTYSYLLSNWADGYWQAKRVGIKGGEQVDLYTWVKGKIDPDTSQGKFILRANFYDSNGTFISRTDLTAMNPSAITAWTRVGGRVTAPATAATMDVIYYLYQSSGWVNIDDVEVTAVAPPANYVTKYYYFGGQRVAMRINGVLTYLHSDHLSSTVLETNASGAIINDEKYRAFGKQRDTGILGTDYQFTGQKQDGSGLVYMNARFFDPLTGMFVSPDTIVPDSGKVFAYNRTMYVYGNPMAYVDPTGHLCVPLVNVGNTCTESTNWDAIQASLDVAGVADPTPISDGANAVISLARGNYTDAGLSAVAMVPYIGDLAKGSKYADEAYAAGKWAVKKGANLLGLSDEAAVGAAKVIDCLTNSFSADTLVMTARGLRPISELIEGDLVLAWDEATGKQGYFVITDTISHVDPEIVLLTIDGEALETTAEHPFYVAEVNEWSSYLSVGKWVEAGALQVGDDVLQANGTTGEVQSVRVVAVSQPMYNLTVDQAHTFFVGQGQWLVHNADCIRAFATRPFAQNTDLNKNIIEEMYRGNWVNGQWVSSDSLPGGLAGAIRRELANLGTLVGGKSHIPKGEQRLTNLKDILDTGMYKGQQLSQSDLDIVRGLHDDLLNALQGK
ncbi:MAG: polymorphic toxin-type HINT domain-containing protein [Caldilineaceae bacterium]